MARNFSDTELDAYLDEALTAELMTEVEGALRGESKLLERLSSINARRPGPGQGIYSVTKAAIVSMTQAFARECGPLGIREKVKLLLTDFHWRLNPGLDLHGHSKLVTEQLSFGTEVGQYGAAGHDFLFFLIAPDQLFGFIQ